MKKIAIVGFGPRGLSALENLFLESFNQKLKTKFTVTLFENTSQLGSGKIWNTGQPEINWINISERALKNLKGRPEIKIHDITIPSFPSYIQWLPKKEKKLKNTDADRFPPRKKMGKYLNERSASILNVLEENNLVRVVNLVITNVDLQKDTLILTSLENHSFSFDEVLISIGHQPTKIPEDVKEYQIASYNKNFSCFVETYPLSTIINSKEIDKEKNVAIRGLGLAMIDVVRALTVEKGGIFDLQNKNNFASKFITNEGVPKQILPYSLDGLPMVPKPLNPKLDNAFKISEKQAHLFENEINKVAKGIKKVSDNSFLKNIIAKISSEIFIELENNNATEKRSKEELENTIVNWLSDIKFKDDLVEDIFSDTVTLIESFVEMACGEKPISLDYCVGQVWRHCQPIFYKSFSHAKVSEEIIAAVIELDEQIKRYSYGPPVESMQQILALSKANILNFEYCNNPKITISEKALHFENKKDKTDVQILINSVLDPPKLLEVTSPIIQNLLKNDLIEPIHSELGIHTQEDGRIISSDSKKNIPLAVLGRLSKGSVVGVDAILECFGIRINNWAKGVVKRIK